MNSGKNYILDEIAKLMSDTANLAHHTKQEFETLLKSKCEKLISNLDLIQRDQFEIVRAMAEKACLDNEILSKKINALEEKIKKIEKKK